MPAGRWLRTEVCHGPARSILRVRRPVRRVARHTPVHFGKAAGAVRGGGSGKAGVAGGGCPPPSRCRRRRLILHSTPCSAGRGRGVADRGQPERPSARVRRPLLPPPPPQPRQNDELRVPPGPAWAWI